MPTARAIRARKLEEVVAALRDSNPRRWSWRRIARKLKISHVGAVKAYKRHLANAGRTLPRDDPGADVAERLGAVVIEIKLSYHVPSNKTRTREGKVYPREDITVVRDLHTILNHESLSPSDGPRLLAQHVGQLLYRRLTFEGWPVQTRSGQDG